MANFTLMAERLINLDEIRDACISNQDSGEAVIIHWKNSSVPTVVLMGDGQQAKEYLSLLAQRLEEADNNVTREANAAQFV